MTCLFSGNGRRRIDIRVSKGRCDGRVTTVTKSDFRRVKAMRKNGQAFDSVAMCNDNDERVWYGM